MKPDEQIPLMTWRVRPDMSCEQVSRPWLEYTGYTPEQALGEGWTRALHPEDLTRWLETCVRAFDERKPFEIEYRLRRRDGEYRWMLERAAPLYADGGLLIGYTGACVDIDAHKCMENGLARALERERRHRLATEEASRLRHDLMVSVLEELRAPAEAIASWAAHLEERTLERHARTTMPHARQPARPGEAGKRAGAGAAALRGARAGRRRRRPGARAAEHAFGRRRRGARGAERRGRPRDAGFLAADVLLSDLGNGDHSLIRELRSLPAERGGCLRAAALGGHPHSRLRRAARQAGRAGGAAVHRGALGPLIA
jgi:PAS domain S-box-containing protein